MAEHEHQTEGYSGASLDLSEEQREALTRRLSWYVEQSQEAHAERDANIDLWHAYYDGRTDAWLRRDEDEWRADVHTHHVRQMIDALAPTLTSIVFQADPVFRVKPRPDQPGTQDNQYWQRESERAQRVEPHLGYLVTEAMGFPDLYKEAVKKAAIEGVAVWLNDWEDRRYRVKVKELKPRLLMGLPAPALAGLLGLQMPQKQLMAVSDREREVVEYVGPKPRLLRSRRDLRTWPADAPTVEDAEAVLIRLWLTDDELEQGEREGLYPSEWLEPLKLAQDDAWRAGGGGQRYRGGQREPDAQDDRAGGLVPAENGSHEVWCIITNWRESPEAEPEECYFVLHAESRTLLRACRYYRIAGRRHVVPMSLIPLDGVNGQSLCEVLWRIQLGENWVLNEALDNLRLLDEPPLVVTDPRVDPNDLEWAPGAMLESTTPGGIQALQVANVSAQAVAIYELIRAMGERLIGLGDTQMGRETEAKRTATEIASLTQAGSVRAEDYQNSCDGVLALLARQWMEMIHRRIDPREELWYERRRSPRPEEVAQAPGQVPETEWVAITSEDYAPGLSVQPMGSTQSANKAVRQKVLTELLPWLTQNPLISGDLTRLWYLTREVLTVFDFEGIDFFIGSMQDAQAQQQQMMQAAQAQQQMAMAQEQARVEGEQARLEAQGAAEERRAALGEQQAQAQHEREREQAALGEEQAQAQHQRMLEQMAAREAVAQAQHERQLLQQRARQREGR